MYHRIKINTEQEFDMVVRRLIILGKKLVVSRQCYINEIKSIKKHNRQAYVFYYPNRDSIYCSDCTTKDHSDDVDVTWKMFPVEPDENGNLW